MEFHVRNAGLLLMVFGALAGVVSLLILLFGGGYDGLLMTDDPFYKRSDIASVPLDRVIAAVFVTVSLLLCAPLVLIGKAIRERKPWARTIGMILAAVCVIYFPVGTGVGVYTLWVLHDEATEHLFHDPRR